MYDEEKHTYGMHKSETFIDACRKDVFSISQEKSIDFLSFSRNQYPW